MATVYESGVAAYRDTTKWLTTFVPLGSMLTATATLGPPLVRSVQRADSPAQWWARHWVLALCLMAIGAGIWSVLHWGAKVLSVAPVDLGRLQEDTYAAKLDTAIGEGVLAPEFFTKEDFSAAMAALANSWDNDAPSDADRYQLTRLKGAVDNLRPWAMFDRVKTAFTHFVYAFTAGTVAIAAGVLIAATQFGSAPGIDKPTPVTMTTNADGRTHLAQATGCTDPTTTDFMIVDGTWSQPVLSVSGPGCRFAATWAPLPGQVVLRPVP